MGKHAASGYGRFTRELSSFTLWLLVVAVVFFGAIWLLVTYVPDWISGGDDESAQSAVGETTSTIEGSSTSVLDVTIFSTVPGSVATTPTSSIPEVTSTTVPPERAPADVSVLVLNSTGQSGLAAGAVALLTNLGYETLEPSNSTPTLSDTQILFAPGFAAEAFTLAAQFPDGTLLENPSEASSADIVVILGTSHIP